MKQLRLISLLAFLCSINSANAQYWNWRAVDSPADSTDLGLVFLLEDGQNGWITTSNSGQILRTEDGGTTWFEAQTLAPVAYHEFSYSTDSTSLYLVGDRGRIYRNRIGEPEWRALNGPKGMDIHGVVLRKTLTGQDSLDRIIVTGKHWKNGQQRPIIQMTDNDGKRWFAYENDFSGERFGTIFETPLHSLQMIHDERIVSSLTGRSNTWIDAYLPKPEAAEPIRHLTFDTYNRLKDIGIAVGDSGLALITFDGGHKWRSLERFTSANLKRAAITNRRSFLVVGDSLNDASTLWMSDTWGSNWNTFPLRILNNRGYLREKLNGVHIVGDRAVVVGNNGTIILGTR